MSNNDHFDWLDREIAEINTPKFFSFNALSSDDTARVVHHSPRLPDTYCEFVCRFGFARLYRQHVGYSLGVRGVPSRVTSSSAEELLCIGHYQYRAAYFKVEALRRHGNSPVFESASSSSLVQYGEGFAAWLKHRAGEVRAAVGPKMWAALIRGPRPFTAKEQQVVSTRAQFRWQALEPTEEGDLAARITNNSTHLLPYFTIGVRDKRGGFEGRVWLPVGHIGPGNSEVVHHQAYRTHIPPRFREFFEVGPPGPEDREHYWEFRQP